MFHSGLVSISFRNHSPEEILSYAATSGLAFIEWGSDLHAPYHDIGKLQQIRHLQELYQVSCCSYGTYFRLGHTAIEELPLYIKAAKILGTNVLRLWAGRKKAADCTDEERDFLFAQCRLAAEIAEEHGVILCLECHRRSYTETKEGALEIMQAVNSPYFKMYWQPNPDLTCSENSEYISLLNPYISHIHVFHWTPEERLSLSEGFDDWKIYLSSLSGDHALLLEFMPDDCIDSLGNETKALHRMIESLTPQPQDDIS